jgi:F-type H+-transporting ATPase subunit b
MQIDWFTFVAQIVNFIILLALLKRFLYDPVLNAIDSREKRIADQLSRASEMKKKAEEHERSVHDMERSLAANREQKLEEARKDAEKHRSELMETSRREVQQRQQHWQQAIERERAAFLERLRGEAGTRVLETARRVLGDLAGEDLEERIRAVFLERLGQLPDEQTERLRKAADEHPDEPIRLEVSAPVDDGYVALIRDALTGIAGRDVKLRVDADSGRGPGIAVRTPGWKFAWTVDEYIDSLELAFREEVGKEEVRDHA